jgi:hypothetical protein
MDSSLDWDSPGHYLFHTLICPKGHHPSFAKTSYARNRLILQSNGSTVIGHANSILFGFRLVILVLGGHRQVALGNAALRQQLAVFKRSVKRPRLRRWDRLFWTVLTAIWKEWRSALVIVGPETVMGWRIRFKRHWGPLSQSKGPGRPRVDLEIRNLLKSMAAAPNSRVRLGYTANS